jgi:two-component system OmpR family sensor kinase
MKLWPLRWVIAATVLLALALSLSLWSLGGYWLAQQFLWTTQEWRTIAMVRMVWNEPDPANNRNRDGLTAISDWRGRAQALSVSGCYARILDIRGQVLAQPSLEAPLDPPTALQIADLLATHAPEHRHRVYAAGSGDRQWMILLQPVRKEGQDVAVLQFCAPWRQPREVRQAMTLYLSLAALVALAIALLLSVLLARRLAAPIRQLQETAQRFQQGDLKARMGEVPEQSRNEFHQVFAGFDRMANHIEQSLTQQRRFVADASHELKTPLTAICGMAEMLKVTSDPAKQSKAIDIISREGERMSRLVSDLLTLSKAEHAPTEPGLGRIELSRWLREGVETVLAAHPNRTIEARSEEGLQLFGNPDELTRMLFNLLENAVLHTPEGAAIEASCGRRPEGIVLSVADQGPGIPKSDIPHLFDRFYRADGSRARRTGGSGLGLAMVKAIATRHGGKVRVISELGKGSVFEVVFREEL